MNHSHEVIFLLLAFFSELIGTVSGVSSSTLFVPLAVLFESVKVALVLTAVLHVVSNTTRTFMYWKNIDWSLALKFGIPSIIMSGIGAKYSDLLSKDVFSVVLGVFLMSFSAAMLFFSGAAAALSKMRWLSYGAGALSGFLTGLLGSGGAIRALALTTFPLGPLAFTATSTLIDFGGDLLRLWIYLKNDYLDSGHYFYLPFLTLVAFGANLLAKRWLLRIKREAFRKVVLILVFVIGLFSSASYFFN